jgi:hypothetical protein
MYSPIGGWGVGVADDPVTNTLAWMSIRAIGGRSPACSSQIRQRH